VLTDQVAAFVQAGAGNIFFDAGASAISGGLIGDRDVADVNAALRCSWLQQSFFTKAAAVLDVGFHIARMVDPTALDDVTPLSVTALMRKRVHRRVVLMVKRIRPTRRLDEKMLGPHQSTILENGRLRTGVES